MQRANEHRNQFYDFVRGISSYLIFFVHSCIQNLEYVWDSAFLSILFYAVVYAIPIFLIISGRLMLRRPYTYYEIFKKIAHFMILIGLWNLLYAIWAYWEQGAFSVLQMTLIHMVKDMWQGSLYYQFWFLYLLIFLYFLTPWLYRLYENHKKRYLRSVMILGIICILFDAINILCEIQGFTYIMQIPQLLRLWMWLFYFMLGGCLADVCRMINQRMSITKGKVIASIFMTICLLLALSKEMSKPVPEMFYGGLLVICSLCLCFTYAQQLELHLPGKLHISKYFIAIYILQIPLLMMTSQLFQMVMQWPFSTVWYFLLSSLLFIWLVMLCSILDKNKFLHKILS